MRNCLECKGKKKERKASNSGNAPIVEENLDIANAFSIIVSNSSDGWILDSSHSYHMPTNMDQFSTYLVINGGKLLMGNKIAYKVVRIGTIGIKMHDDIVRTLIVVRHVLKLKKILISLGYSTSMVAHIKLDVKL